MNVPDSDDDGHRTKASCTGSLAMNVGWRKATLGGKTRENRLNRGEWMIAYEPGVATALSQRARRVSTRLIFVHEPRWR